MYMLELLELVVSLHSQEEPEWMSFGPTDRSEVIELVGLEEHERGRDGGE